MLLLHISDIHFHKGAVNSAFDPDQLLRSQLIQDAEAQCKKLGEPLSAILVSGDIAFSGQKAEYDFAKLWLEELAHKTGTDLTAVFTCPGNHDVDRAVTRGGTNRLLRQSIKDTPPLLRRNALASQLEDTDSNDLLFKPIAQYNLFAQQFFCALTPPKETVAKRALKLNDGSLLRLWGINSTLVSGEEDAAKELVPDPAFFQIIKTPGEEHLTICHHPPTWMKDDGKEMMEHLNACVRLQLYGHVHDHRIARDTHFVHVFAGAVQPERDGPDWKPGYNLIQLKVEGVNEERVLDIQIHARVWDNKLGKFIIQPDRESDVHSHKIKLQAWMPPAPPAAPQTKVAPAQAQSDAAVAVHVQETDPMDSVRSLGIRFFKLNLSQRFQIAGELGLFDEADENKTDVERYRDVFKRVIERELTTQLDSAITKLEEAK